MTVHDDCSVYIINSTHSTVPRKVQSRRRQFLEVCVFVETLMLYSVALKIKTRAKIAFGLIIQNLEDLRHQML